jgi:hypothetical protein
MRLYKSRSGKESGITAYESGDTFIKVRFNNGDIYTYSYNSASKVVIETMKRLAENQEGLSTYISQHKLGFE